MAKKIRFEIEVDGEEKSAWIEVSSAVEKAAMAQAWENNESPAEGFVEILSGITVEDVTN